jgi:hypothetical protein
MMTATENFTMVFQRLSDDDPGDGEEKDIIGAGSISEPEVSPDKKFATEEDPLEPDADSLEDEIEKELGDDDEGEEM